MYKIKIAAQILILIFLCACIPNEKTEPTDNNQPYYGEEIFDMACVWPSASNIHELTVYCNRDVVETSFLSAENLSIYLLQPEGEEDYLTLCGQSIDLDSGYETYDRLLWNLTKNQHNCLKSYDLNKGNEFDWFWYEETRILQFIWRPRNILGTKIMTLVIDEPSNPNPNEVTYYTSQGIIFLLEE